MFIILRDGTGLLQCVLSNVLVSITIIQYTIIYCV